MTTYKDLTIKEKLLFRAVENQFLTRPEVLQASFVKVLFMLGNKYKYKKELL